MQVLTGYRDTIDYATGVAGDRTSFSNVKSMLNLMIEERMKEGGKLHVSRTTLRQAIRGETSRVLQVVKIEEYDRSYRPLIRSLFDFLEGLTEEEIQYLRRECDACNEFAVSRG
jgi:hypothetical protein